ncbi:lysM and putative peptidoglycan-binding domain-containing protein 4 isoform X2 [Cygnus olor]|uniref:lysM and putative peptidoglycan-binding domain-containing protein 4 isoform X2 n=1 Tax=Cygnus olor TaxID=8869 RepID=UPI001ADE1FFC|nr:lysM and putative peptidoglycan-binding domain-containing protein 4 isoform X2 [Cygnus olor]
MRLNEGRPSPFQAPVSVHGPPGRQLHVFPGRSPPGSEESSEEELSAMELRPRGREQQRCGAPRDRAGDVVLLEREVTEDDSLNKLALQYGCKVADIKRVNNFIREQDLYALKSIKIPVKPHGLLTESSRELRPAPAPRCPSGVTLVDLPEPEAGASGSEGSRLSDYFKGIDQSIQEAVRAEVQLNDEYCTEALERPLCHVPLQSVRAALLLPPSAFRMQTQDQSCSRAGPHCVECCSLQENRVQQVLQQQKEA